MIKLPKDINKIINQLTNSGYEVYCAGQCVTASYAGADPLDWDLYTDCPQDKLKELFPEGESITKRTTRLDYSTEVISDDLNVADHFEGVIADIVTLQGSIEDQVKIYDLTVEAIAEHPQKSPVDPYGGREDAKAMLLKPAPGAEETYKKYPERMLKAIKYVSLYGFDLHKSMAELLNKNARLLLQGDKEEILYEYIQILSGKNPGKALKMMADLGLLAGVIGEKAVSSAGKSAVKEFDILVNNIDKTKQIPLRRMALVAMCFGKRYNDIISYLPHDEEDLDMLIDADRYTQDLHFAGNDVMLKKFIYKHGWDKFHFYDKLSKAQVIVFDYNDAKIEGREHILKMIAAERQPIFEEDLAIDVNDIMEAGITDDPARAEYILSLLPAVVHQKPKKNERKELLTLAKKYSKSKMKAGLRGVEWLR
ncbi:MAG: hypothetical protein Q4B18_04270 [Bacillota bacterium]|nr:hypothetical protein [Bacillota bacterium]